MKCRMNDVSTPCLKMTKRVYTRCLSPVSLTRTDTMKNEPTRNRTEDY